MSSVSTSTVRLGDFIKNQRLKKGLSIEEVSENAQVDKETYCAIEENKLLTPGLEDLFFLFKELDLTFNDFDFKMYFKYVLI